MGTNWFFIKPPTHPMGTTTDAVQNLRSWLPPDTFGLHDIPLYLSTSSNQYSISNLASFSWLQKPNNLL